LCAAYGRRFIVNSPAEVCFMLKHSKVVIGLVTLAAAGVAAFGAHAFTASNTVAATAAGGGSAAISGYDVSSVGYTYSADGATITAVSFSLDKAASDVKAALVASPGSADWQDCGASTGSAAPYSVSCTLATPVAVAAATKLSVLAVGSGSVTIAS
jgi:hypothetical protein